MSTSAADYYKVAYLKASHANAEANLQYVQDTLERLHQRLEECQERVSQSKEKVEAVERSVHDAQTQLAAAEDPKRKLDEDVIPPDWFEAGGENFGPRGSYAVTGCTSKYLMVDGG